MTHDAQSNNNELPAIVYDSIGPWRLMAQAEGYVMVRRPGAMPHVISVKKWLELEQKSRSEHVRTR